MRAALERGAGAGPLLLLAAAALVAAALFFGGGASDGRLLWIGGAAIAVAALTAAATPARPPGAAFAALLAAFVVWNGLSILWSVEPDRSWSYFNRGATYLAFALLGLFLGSLVPRAPRLVAQGFALLVAAVVVWALLGKVFPDLYPGAARIARLRSPVGFWNALALLIAMALPLGLWLAAVRRHMPVLRASAVLGLYAALVGLLLTYSRGGIAVALVVVTAWLLVAGRERLESLAALALAVPFALAVSLWAFTRPGVADDNQPHSVRVHDGARFGVVLAVVGGLVFALALLAARAEALRPLAERQRSRLTRLALAGGAAAALVALVVFSVRAGNPATWVRDRVKDFANPQTSLVTQESTRLTDFSSNNRWPWWRDSWHLFEDNPVAGTGAGSFRVAHRRVRTNDVEVLEPHNLPLQFLSETGLVGLALIGAAWAAAALGIVRTVRRNEDRLPALALALGALAYPLHGLLDFDWDFVAVSAPSLLVAGVLLGSSTPAAAGRRSLLRTAVAAVLALVLLYSLASPHLAQRRLDDSFDALARDDAPAAVSAAKKAHSLNPLAIRPYFAWAAAENVRGNETEALRLYGKAVDLQPENSDTWYRLALYERLLGEEARARRHLTEAARLDPHGPPADCLEDPSSCR
jgi:O-antigen ligase/polysaccharide polymerase Wzy-like membrane protein